MIDKERVKIDNRPVKLRIESEPYARFIGRKYCVVIDVYDAKWKREYYLIIEPQSLSQPLFDLVESEGELSGLVVWVSKESDEKYSKYQVELA